MRNSLRPKPDPVAYARAALRTLRYHAQDWLGIVKPLKLRIGLTNRCNARCIMCNIWKQEDNTAPFLPHEIRPDELDTIFQRNRRFFSNLKHISLTGGEPTLRRDFVEIWRVLHEHFPDLNMSFNSNGFSTAKTLAYVEEILSFHPRLTVMISLDGMGESHDRVRGLKRVFAHTMATIEGVAALRPRHPYLKLEINYVLTPYNVDDCVELFRFCRERSIAFNPIYCVQGELYFNEEEDNVSLAEDARQRYLEHFRNILEEDDSLQTREIVDQLMNRPRDFDCWAGRITYLIEENANVYPNGGCPSDFLMGNLRDFDYSFEELLASPRAQEVLRKAKSCRICRLSCETMTTLQHPEALAGYRKSRELPFDGAVLCEVRD
ncbi:MAG: radical SAM protein [Candidatus Hydrogenedentota bacterium]|uniref:Radical SAM domain protein n=1 Tax=Sumerlaea chitinivorans TaxID=2250252 RepID=A0A2Z4Y6P3_SUMC1|nr:radical SAM domain protein [Candidatus Sumerlaea chitinivorans]MCX7963772.1 radical SAM protein [Candidatus Sumerlaea chitinivorans]RMH25558.1 MAG: radical SAM protein [Candidatus Hydrogenedentota bacterium]